MKPERRKGGVDKKEGEKMGGLPTWGGTGATWETREREEKNPW